MPLKHNIKNINFDKDYISLTIDGKKISILLETVSKKLKAADEYQRMLYKISPSGYGIHWPLIDEDLAINALLKIA
ncbi:MAG: DUF2442 domain-containing protein [Saprospiraceae bacterium]